MNHAMETSGEGNKNSSSETLPNHQSFPLKEQIQANSATRKSLTVLKSDSESKKLLVANKRRSDQDFASNHLFPHRNQGKSKRNKLGNRKLQKSRSLFEEEEKQMSWSNGIKGFQTEKEELIPPEKPTLIKTFSFDQDEYEVTLETFLNHEYVNSEKNDQNGVKPTEYNIKSSSAYRLINPEPERVIHLTNQMKFRLQEGKGEAKYEIGVTENGVQTGLTKGEMHQSLRTLCSIASSLQADVIILSLRNATHGKIADVLIRSHQKDGIKLDIKIMLLGDKQCGKSTLIGVLTSGRNDNGKGSARSNVHSHKHEVLSGETSTLSHHILGFDSQGMITNNLNSENSTWEQIVDKSTKILTFIDIGGHEKFTAKIVSGLCSFYPDYTGIVISAVEGLTQITEQHLKIASLFGVPFFIVITHIDLVNSETFYELRDDLEKSMRKYSEDNQLVVAQNEEDNIILTRTLKEKIVVPVFMISNVTGKNMDLFKSFLNLLPVNNPLSPNINLHSEFYIHTIFNRDNKTILGGTVIKGSIKKHQVLALGPDEKGKFWHIEVSSIQYKKVPVKFASCGQSCTIEIKLGKFAQQWINSNKDALRRGMVLVDIKSNPKATIEFVAEINLFEEKQTKVIIWEGYEPVITSQTTHQVCAIDFDQIKAEEIREEDLLKLKQLTDSLSSSRAAKKKSSVDEFNLPLLNLTRQKSKSQDFKEIQSQYKQRDEGLEKSPGRKLSSFSRRKLANVFLKTNMSVSEENIHNNLSGGGAKTKKNSKGNFETSSHFKQLFDEVGHSSMGLQQKLKKLQKDIYLYAEDFAPKKKTQIKFITIEPNQPKILRFRFKYHSEYLTKGQKIIINDSTMKAVGTIRDLFYVTTET